MDYLKRALELQDELIANRRQLHQNPEVGLELPQTAAFVEEKLKEMGYEPQRVAGCGVTALAGGKPGRTILLRADMDALPMREESGLSFASQRDCAHTCGHDLHTAMLLGAAKMLKESEDALNGQVKFMFQPAEENILGAKAMIQAGILENPKVDAAVALHIATGMSAGLVGYKQGVFASSSDTFTITITGKGGHGARPNISVDPINAACHLHLALQEIISREVDPDQAVVLTIGSFQAGSAHNIIPEKAVLQGTLRTVDSGVRDFALGRMKEIAQSVATAFRATVEVRLDASVSPLLNDPEVTRVAGGALKEMLGSSCISLEQRMMGSEDFAEVASRVPALYFLVGGGSEVEGYCHAGHHPKVRFDEKSLAVGAAAYAAAAAGWLAAEG